MNEDQIIKHCRKFEKKVNLSRILGSDKTGYYTLQLSSDNGTKYACIMYWDYDNEKTNGKHTESLYIR